MSVVGLMLVRDELDVLPATLGHLLTQVDHVIVSDNGSVDGTLDYLTGLADDKQITLYRDEDPAYYQSRKMTELARCAWLDHEAEWVVSVDADECWYSPFGRIADVLAGLALPTTIVTAALYDHVATAVDPTEGDVIARMGWRRREPAGLPKVACRPSIPVVIEQGNHGAIYPFETVDGLLVVRHFPYRSPEQMAHKVRNGAAAYAATDLPETAGVHWRRYGAIQDAGGDQAVHAIFHEWFWHADPAGDPTLIYDPAPIG